MYIDIPPLCIHDYANKEGIESSLNIRKRVFLAREKQNARYSSSPIGCNAKLTVKGIKEFCKIDPDAKNILLRMIDKFKISARSHDRIIKVAQTIADLEGATTINSNHIAEAIQFRSLKELC